MPLTDYLARYQHEHHNRWNRALHGIGIPAIFLSLLLLILGRWWMALAAFVGGCMLLFLGHRIEGNRPAFFQGPVYFLVGPLWVAREIRALFGKRPQSSTAAGQPAKHK